MSTLSSTVRRALPVLVSATLTFSTPIAVLAQSSQDEKTKISTDRRIDEIVRQAAERFAAGGDVPVATAQAGAPYKLSLDDAVKLALEHNLDIQVERLNPQTYDYSLAALQSTFQPSFTSAFTNNNVVTFPSSQLTTRAPTLTTDTLLWNTGLSQSLKWGGRQLRRRLQ